MNCTLAYQGAPTEWLDLLQAIQNILFSSSSPRTILNTPTGQNFHFLIRSRNWPSSKQAHHIIIILCDPRGKTANIH